MKENTSVLRSEYIIDGVRMDATPQAMLDMACEKETEATDEAYEAIVDESVDPSPFAETLQADKAEEYLAGIQAIETREFPVCHSESFTNGVVAQALLNAIWQAGHFRLGDLAISAHWKWNDSAIGNMAALYRSIESACDYLDALGVRMKNYRFSGSESMATEMKVSLSDQSAVPDFEPEEETDDFFRELPFRTEHHTLRHNRKCPETASGNKKDWIIYIPFDTCDLLLGGSALAQAIGKSCGKAPEIYAADYFIDCYEVVRELVEDGILSAGTTVGQGGIMTAMQRMLPEGMGINLEIGGIMKSYNEKDITRVLFSEVPGVIIEVPDDDYDYVDAELLLQDVAYYPLGHITKDFSGIRTSESDNSDITEILHSLLNGQVSEGED